MIIHDQKLTRFLLFFFFSPTLDLLLDQWVPKVC